MRGAVFLILYFCSSYAALTVTDATVHYASIEHDVVKHVAIASFAPVAIGNFGGNTFFDYYNNTNGFMWSQNITTTMNVTEGVGIVYDSYSAQFIVGLNSNAVTLNYSNNGQSTESHGDFDIVFAFYGYSGNYYGYKRYGGPSDEKINGLAVDDNTYSPGFYVCGTYSGPTELGNSSSPLPFNGTDDMFIARYLPNGVHVWSVGFGGELADSFDDIALDTNNIFVVGTFESASLSFPNATLTKVGPQPNLVVAKFSKNKEFMWARQGYGTGTPMVSAVSVDSSSNSYVAGSANQINFGGVLVTGTVSDAFLFKFDSDGNVTWGISIGGSLGTELGIDVAVYQYASIEAVYLLGSFMTNFSQDGIYVGGSGAPSAFVSKHNLNDGAIFGISPITFNGFDLEVLSLTINQNFPLTFLVGGSIDGAGQITPSLYASTQTQDGVVLVLSEPTPSPSPTSSTAPSHSPSRSPSPTPTASVTPTLTPSSQPGEGSDVPVAVIAGSTAGGATGCALIVVVAGVFWCRKKKKKEDSTSDEDDPTEIEL